MIADVLIVGAGSAGSVLAERLSANPDTQVTVLETGPGRDSGRVRALTDDATVLPIGPASPVVRRYRTALTADRANPVDIVRGACLGGSGAVNGGYFCRALPTDFDDIPGWSWADVEQHYRAIATDLDFPDPHGGGPIAVRRVGQPCPSTAEFVAAATAAGFGWLPDLNAEPTGARGLAGVGAVPLNIVDGVRIGPGAAFLEPALQRPNLRVLTGMQVTRVRTSAGRALGVDAVGPHGSVRLAAGRVVLCAGAIESARLLLISGIGPAAQLTALGIPVVADLPVGQTFSDHPEWVMRTGSAPSSHRPVLEAVLVTDGLEVRPYTTGFPAMTGQAGPGAPHIGVVLTRPRARGRLTLTRADPEAPPHIEHRYDSEPADLADLRRGCDLVAEILRGTTPLGGPRWSTSQHLCGTASMGAVVDPHCRVHGVAGLSVVDGSILPRITSRGPHATIVMLAHRAAEFL